MKWNITPYKLNQPHRFLRQDTNVGSSIEDVDKSAGTVSSVGPASSAPLALRTGEGMAATAASIECFMAWRMSIPVFFV